MTKLRIIVAGLIGRAPVGGWHYLQYIAGLAALGHDVYYHEDTWCWPYDPVRNSQVDDPSYSVDYLRGFFADHVPARSGQWHYVHLHDRSHGMTRQAFDEVARTADVFLDVGGANLIPDALSPRCVRVMIDTDPGFNQIVLRERFAWSENVDRWCQRVAAYDQHFTYASNIDALDCRVPRLSFRWQPTRPPVDLAMWREVRATTPPRNAPWTTIMTWNPFPGPLVHEGREYGAKGPEFEQLIDLPRAVPVPLELAVGGTRAPRERLVAHGWRVVDGPTATRTPRLYRAFLTRSRGELSCAKEVYVALRTGWFSERTACYLACGRPAVVQDTAFTAHVPVGEGLLAFADAEGARTAIQRVEADYDRHARAAYEIAAEHFAGERVLPRLLERIGATNA